jgi:hypothetical protein
VAAVGARGNEAVSLGSADRAVPINGFEFHDRMLARA